MIVSPSPTAGSGLKLDIKKGSYANLKVSPSPTAGSGLKQLFKQGKKNKQISISQPNRWERIETRL